MILSLSFPETDPAGNLSDLALNGNPSGAATTLEMYDQYYGDAGMDAGGADAMAFDCGGEFDDCSAFAAADAFAVF